MPLNPRGRGAPAESRSNPHAPELEGLGGVVSLAHRRRRQSAANSAAALRRDAVAGPVSPYRVRGKLPRV
jgi:hypothetical protein